MNRILDLEPIATRVWSPEHKALVDLLDKKAQTPVAIPGSTLLNRGIDCIYLELYKIGGLNLHVVINAPGVIRLIIDPTSRVLEVHYTDPNKRYVNYGIDGFRDFSFIKTEDLKNARPDIDPFV